MSFTKTQNKFSKGIDDKSNSTAVTIDEAGSVGIGVDAPERAFHAKATQQVTGLFESTGNRCYLGFTDFNTALAQYGPLIGSSGDDFAIATGASNTVRLTVDPTGNVGVGVSGAGLDEPLVVQGNIKMRGASGLWFTNTSDIMGLKAVNSNILQLQANTAAGELKFQTNSQERMTITSSGNVGINTSSPSNFAKLDAAGSVISTAASLGTFNADNAGFDFVGSTKFGRFFATSADTTGGVMTFTTGQNGSAKERMRIDESGNVGIGTNSPNGVKLNIKTATGSNAALRLSDAVTQTLNVIVDGTASTGGIHYQNPNVGYQRWTNANVERMRLDASGNLLVGTTSISGVQAGSENGTVIEGAGGSILKSRSTTNNRSQMAFYNPNGLVGQIATSGSATTYATSSDARLKRNIVDAPAGNIDAIKVRSFDWKTDGEHQKYGFIAQELETVAPYAVSKGETDEDTWGVDYSKLVPMLVKEIQDLKAEVAALKGA